MSLKIVVSAKWDDEKRRYVPDQFSLEGEGNEVIVSYELVANADPEYIRIQNRALIFGPYVLEIMSQTADLGKLGAIAGAPDGDYVCRLLTDPKSIEFALNTPWEGMGR